MVEIVRDEKEIVKTLQRFLGREKEASDRNKAGTRQVPDKQAGQVCQRLRLGAGPRAQEKSVKDTQNNIWDQRAKIKRDK